MYKNFMYTIMSIKMTGFTIYYLKNYSLWKKFVNNHVYQIDILQII